MLVLSLYFFFFFKQKTAYEIPKRDWSSDVCSSDLDLGALEIVPKSHVLGLLESVENDWYRTVEGTADDKYVSVEVKAGDALFFSAFLLHRSGNNITDSVRWSCHFRYNDLAEPTFIERKYPNPYIYKPEQDLITKDLDR